MKRGSIFETDGIPRMSEALPLAMQHVVAMIVGCVTPAIIVSGAVPGGLSREDQVILIQSALVIAALSTLLQLFPIGGKAKFAIGSGLPIIMGVSFAYVPSMQAIAESYGIAAIMGAEIVGGVVAVVMGLLVKKIRVFFPPLITGTVVFTIGLSLYPTAINYMAGGTSSPNYGSWQNWAIAFFTLIVVTALQTIESDISRNNISFKSSVCNFYRKRSCHDHLVLHLTEGKLAGSCISTMESHECICKFVIIFSFDIFVIDILRNRVVDVKQCNCILAYNCSDELT